MTDDSSLSVEVRNVLESGVRKKILLLLYDGSEKSAYAIAKNDQINLAITSAIQHLNKLEKAGLIESRDATKGNLKRYYYKITKQGKNLLQEYYTELFNEFREYISIDEMANLVNTFMVLEAIFLNEKADLNDISRRTGLNSRLVARILWKFRETGIIVELPAKYPPVDKKTLRIMIDKNDLEKIIQHYQNAINELKESKKILIKSQEKIPKKPKRKPFSIKR